ncbi:xylan 1,4-beta-xylosidase [Hydrogenispora ethanolica]|uniref:Xylan 1,4-beta-xylosidase n=1 Tax=Hydrogenispora ethanolica TaxID=1082276 RepID=A0A4R1RUL9_HYDET|nr:glycoside hydrolase family 43 protein [Hydrogenispora ethanolica]TCL70074.1 xylan 1,4-beta-xylosidase [Hydrogenispora ethanolica]
MKQAPFYTNPVLTGFFPDPSVVRVGEDYYMVNSTFEYFPAIVISHSRDLVHWEIIGHAITRDDYLDLSGIDDSHGVWAPDLSYHNGKFYIFATLRLNGEIAEAGRKIIRRQMILTADRPEGPYSKPLFVDVDGIDPSHFVDDDGTHYMVLHQGRLLRLNRDCSAAAGEPVTLWQGTGGKSPEGPHLLKKDGFYYLMLAEGGTEYGHRVTMARSRNLYGPYEPSPYNPVLTQTDPDAPIQRAGHGKLVQTQGGDWWMVYLCGRPNQGRFTTLGRETALDPVRWTEDGWLLVNEGKGPSAIQTVPGLPAVRYAERFRDDFDSVKLSFDWQFVRNPDPAAWSLKERPGYLRILTGNAAPGSKEARNIILRREKHHRYSAGLKLEFHPGCNGEEAGLICYRGLYSFIALCLIYENGLKVRLIENRNNIRRCLGESESIRRNQLFLRVSVDRQLREFYYRDELQNWKMVGRVDDASFLSDEGITIGKHHTGTLVGMYAANGGNGNRVAADFDWFEYCPGE